MQAQMQARDSVRQFRYWEVHLQLLRLTEADMTRTVHHFFPKQLPDEALRDPVGGALIHWCVLLGSGERGVRMEKHRKLALHIINTCRVPILNLQFNRNAATVHKEHPNGKWLPNGRTRNLPYEKLYYDGETSLHIAVAKDDPELVRMLLGRGVDSRIRAYGSFFAPGSTIVCYYGEYALSFAAAGGLDAMASILIASDPDLVYLTDTFGNTCFHMAVLHKRISTYEKLVDLSGLDFTEIAEWKGAMGLTPLSLAALSRRGNESIVESVGMHNTIDTANEADDFMRILNTTRSVAWEFNDVVAHSYKLAQIDTLGFRRKISKKPRLVAKSVFVASRGKVAPPTPPPPPSVNAFAGGVGPAGPQVIRPQQPAPGEDASGIAIDIQDSPAQMGCCSTSGGSSAATGFVSVISLVLQYDLLYLADSDMVVAILETKWRVVKYFFYISVIWHLVYLGFITALLVEVHPNGRQAESHTLSLACLIMTVLDIVPNLYDILVGVSHCLDTLNLRKYQVVRAERPPQMDSHSVWSRYQTFESGTVAIVRQTHALQSQYPSLFFVLSSFPISGFELVAWLGYAFYLIHVFIGPEEDGSVAPLHNTTYPHTVSATITAAFPDPTTIGSTPPAAHPREEAAGLSTVFLGLSVMCAWIATLTYSPVHVRTGMFVTMMTRTIFRDLCPFILVYAFLLTGVSAAVYALQRDGFNLLTVIDALKDELLPVIETNERIKVWNPPDSELLRGPGTHFRIVVYVLVAGFTAVSSVLMLNLLIATFTSTYEEVKDIAHKEWRLQWGRDILMLERRVSVLPWFREKLRVNHGASHDHVYVSIKKKERCAPLVSGMAISTLPRQGDDRGIGHASISTENMQAVPLGATESVGEWAQGLSPPTPGLATLSPAQHTLSCPRSPPSEGSPARSFVCCKCGAENTPDFTLESPRRTDAEAPLDSQNGGGENSGATPRSSRKRKKRKPPRTSGGGSRLGAKAGGDALEGKQGAVAENVSPPATSADGVEEAGGASGGAEGLSPGSNPLQNPRRAGGDGRPEVRCDTCRALLTFTTKRYPVKVECPKCHGITRVANPRDLCPPAAT